MTDTLSRERKLREVLNYYDPIVNKLDAHVDGPETDFVMRRDDYRIMRAALRSRSGVVVPREPTATMIEAGWDAHQSWTNKIAPENVPSIARIYRAMLAARPKE